MTDENLPVPFYDPRIEELRRIILDSQTRALSLDRIKRARAAGEKANELLRSQNSADVYRQSTTVHTDLMLVERIFEYFEHENKEFPLPEPTRETHPGRWSRAMAHRTWRKSKKDPTSDFAVARTIHELKEHLVILHKQTVKLYEVMEAAAVVARAAERPRSATACLREYRSYCQIWCPSDDHAAA